jgi:hypothetical protein
MARLVKLTVARRSFCSDKLFDRLQIGLTPR